MQKQCQLDSLEQGGGGGGYLQLYGQLGDMIGRERDQKQCQLDSLEQVSAFCLPPAWTVWRLRVSVSILQSRLPVHHPKLSGC